MPTYQAACLCQQIRWEVTAPLSPIRICHCHQCQRASGSAFLAITTVQQEQVSWLQGRAQLKSYSASAGKRRWFCSHCGSPIYSERDSAPGVLRLRVGTFIDLIPVKPISHAYTVYQANWCAILDDVPQYPEAVPD